MGRIGIAAAHYSTPTRIDRRKRAEPRQDKVYDLRNRLSLHLPAATPAIKPDDAYGLHQAVVEHTHW